MVTFIYLLVNKPLREPPTWGCIGGGLRKAEKLIKNLKSVPKYEQGPKIEKNYNYHILTLYFS